MTRVVAGSLALAGISIAAIAAAQQSSSPTTAPTFATDVAPILYKNCASCYRPGPHINITSIGAST